MAIPAVTVIPTVLIFDSHSFLNLGDIWAMYYAFPRETGPVMCPPEPSAREDIPVFLLSDGSKLAVGNLQIKNDPAPAIGEELEVRLVVFVAFGRADTTPRAQSYFVTFTWDGTTWVPGVPEIDSEMNQICSTVLSFSSGLVLIDFKEKKCL